MMLRFISALGLVTMILCAWALSGNRRQFPWRTVIWGMMLQFAFAIFILKTPFGAAIFAAAQRAIDKLNLFAIEGAQMVFGPLAMGDVLKNTFGTGNSYIFAVSISATIIVISAFSSLFYHWGILQRVVHGMAWVMRSAMRTSGSESLAAASNIFLGQTEAALLVRPYIPRMTMSELMALMTTGMATIASGVMIVYTQLGVDAGHLLTASVLSAPAGLLIAKIMFPETGVSETRSTSPASEKQTTVNSIDAICRGAGEGIGLAINVMGMLIAFVALANYVLSLLQRLVGVAHPFTLQTLLGYLNWPFAWVMGVPAKDCLGRSGTGRTRCAERVHRIPITHETKSRARSTQLHAGNLRALRLCEFFEHRDSDRRNRSARAGSTQRSCPDRHARNDRRIARVLSHGVSRRSSNLEMRRLAL